MPSTEEFPSHSSPVISPSHLPSRPSAHFLSNANSGWPTELGTPSQPSTPGVPHNLISPAYTPPLSPRVSAPGTPGLHPHLDTLSSHPVTSAAASGLRHEPKSIPVDTSLDDPAFFKQPRLLTKLPKVECVVRARIPTTSGAEMFLHLYTNDADNKEHLAIVFGNGIRSRSLDAERPGESEMDRMIRGAYVGRLRPGRTSSRTDNEADLRRKVLKQSPTTGEGAGIGTGRRKRSGSALKHVQSVDSYPPPSSTSVAAAGNDDSAATTPRTSAASTFTTADSTSSTPKTSTSTIPDLDDVDDKIEEDPDQDREAESTDDRLPPPKPTMTLPSPPQFSASSPPLPLTSPSHTPTASSVELKPPLVRIHSECYTGETAWSARCDCGEQLDEAARLMSTPSLTNPDPQNVGGVIVYLRQEGRGIGLASKLKAYNLQDLGNDTVEANLLLRHPADARSYGLATAILQDLGLGTDEDAHRDQAQRGIRLLTNNPDKVRAVEGNTREVRVVERVAMVPLAWKSGGSRGVHGAEIEKYLETKIGRMGHMIHE